MGNLQEVSGIGAAESKAAENEAFWDEFRDPANLLAIAAKIYRSFPSNYRLSMLRDRVADARAAGVDVDAYDQLLREEPAKLLGQSIELDLELLDRDLDNLLPEDDKVFDLLDQFRRLEKNLDSAERLGGFEDLLDGLNQQSDSIERKLVSKLILYFVARGVTHALPERRIINMLEEMLIWAEDLQIDTTNVRNNLDFIRKRVDDLNRDFESHNPNYVGGDLKGLKW